MPPRSEQAAASEAGAGLPRASFAPLGGAGRSAALGGTCPEAPGLSPAKENDLIIEAPELAENGTNVPVTLTSKIPKTDFIALIADHNPNPVCVGFNVMPDTEPYYSVRIKVAETSAIIAVARSEGKWYYTLKDITVMLGGCLG